MPAQCCKDKFALIPDDEPVFTIRGKDLLASQAIRTWMAAAEEAGVNQQKMDGVNEHLEAIERFQLEHPERCQIPD